MKWDLEGVVLPYLYLYTFTLLIFLISFFFLSKEGISVKTARGRRIIAFLISGLLLYMVIHGLFQFILPWYSG